MPVHRSVSMLFTAVLCCSTLTSFVVAVMDVSFRPPEGAFLLRKSGQKTEDMERHWLGTAFLPGGCAARPDQTLLVEHANFKQEVPLLPLAALHHNRSCGVSVRPVADSVDVQRPYVDALVYADKDFLAFYDHPVCVTVLATWSGRSTVASCSLFSRTQRFACLARLVLPVDWFDLSDQQQSSGKRPRRYVQLSYTTEHFNSCPASVERTIAQLDGITTPVPSPILLRNEGAYETLEIDRQESWSVSLMVPTNMTLSAKSYTSFFLHFAYQASTEHNNPPLFLFQLRVRFHRFRLISFATTDVANWSVKGEPAIDDNDTISFICLYNNGMSLNETWSGPIFAMLLETKGDGDSTTLDAEASIHWDVRYVVDRRAAARSALLPRNDSQTVEENSAANSTTTTVTPPKIAAFNKYTSTISSAIQNHDSGKITMQFTISKDTTYAIVVAAKSNELINTAVLSGLQSSILLRIYSITLGGDVSDVTFKSSCKSLEPRVLKSSPSCSTVFVDGSELRGMAEAIVEATFETFSTTTTFIVWYPKMPVTVWLSDPVLNAVKDWRLPVLKQLDIKDNSVPAVNSAPRRKRAEAKQLTCRVLYQQAEVKVFAQFHVNSRYSRTSTIGAGDSLEMRTETEHVTLGSASYGSADTAARRSVSYRGSEVSIFISPQPLMRVNEPHRTTERRTASWTSKPRSRVRITANPLADSSSEQNLSTLAASSPLGIDGPALARSAGQVDWDSASLGLNEAEMHHYIDGLRETIA
uniref:Transmembrane protein family 132 middle domain-containing protein n=1 Tax=Plectus sambesii TaxID=2011161 RepID=A0A914W794_9BILA